MTQASSSTEGISAEKPFGDNTGEIALRELVRRLTDNYFDASFDDGRPDSELQVEYGRVFKSDVRDFQKQRRCRNIVIVGAGASFATFGGERFPVAREAIHRLREHLGVPALIEALRHADHDARTGTDRLKEEEDRIRLLMRVDSPETDFESQLAIYSQFYAPRQVRAAIHSLYNKRYYPHLVFETIAHLLKHRFVDAVINYNFDELLDQAIEDELAGSEYKLILSDGDTYDISRFVIDAQLKVPLYIKPHGTASHKSSLRFTKDDYIGMPSDLQEFTRKILHGHTHEDPGAQRERLEVNLICVGFAFSSIELLYALRGHTHLNVFHVNTLRGMPQLADQVSQHLKDCHADHYYLAIDGEKGTRTGLEPDPVPPAASTRADVAERDLTVADGVEPAPSVANGSPETEHGGDAVPVQSGEGGDPATKWTWQCMEGVFRELPRKIALRFNDLYRPRSLDRHMLVHTLLFCARRWDDDVDVRDPRWPRGSGVRVPVEEKHYHYARLCIEIAIALAKGNGRIDLTGAMQDRVGTYYKQWREFETGEGRPLREVCVNEFGLAEHYGFSRTIYATDPADLEGIEPDEIPNYAAGVIERRLYKALRKIDDAPLRDHLRDLTNDERGTVTEVIRKLVNSDVHDIAPTFDLRSLVLITEPRNAAFVRTDPRTSVLHTSLRLTSEFHQMVRADNWQLMLAISEHGKVLEKLRSVLEALEKDPTWSRQEPRIPKRASVIVADYPENRLLDRRLQRYKAELVHDAFRLPFWAHNNHMVITLRMDFDRGSSLPVRWTPVKAIAYPKLALSPKVNPILVEEREDLERLVTMYFGYVAKARQFRPGKRVKDQLVGVPDVKLKYVNQVRDELLDAWWQEMVKETNLLTPKP